MKHTAEKQNSSRDRLSRLIDPVAHQRQRLHSRSLWVRSRCIGNIIINPQALPKAPELLSLCRRPKRRCALAAKILQIPTSQLWGTLMQHKMSSSVHLPQVQRAHGDCGSEIPGTTPGLGGILEASRVVIRRFPKLVIGSLGSCLSSIPGCITLPCIVLHYIMSLFVLFHDDVLNEVT